MFERESKTVAGYDADLRRHPKDIDEENKKKSSKSDSIKRYSTNLSNGNIKEESGLLSHAKTIDHTGRTSASIRKHTLLHLQSKFGNRYVQRALSLSQSRVESEVGSNLEDAIERKRGGGQAMDSGIRRQMESSFNADFSKVRIHKDSEANSLNHAVNARAFTVGQDVFFQEGEYNPASWRGRELLAHELAHVVQQRGGLETKLEIGQEDDACEREADEMARAVIRAEDAETKQAPGYPSRIEVQPNLGDYAAPSAAISQSPPGVTTVETGLPILERSETRHQQRGQVESKVIVPIVQRRNGGQTGAAPTTARPTRFRPPPGVGGRRIGTGVVEDIGSTVGLVREIERILHPAFKAGGSQALATIRATYSNDNVRQNATNMIQGTALICGPFTGETRTDNYRGDVAVSASMGPLTFDRADESSLTTSSQSQPTTSATGGITTGVQGQLSGQVGGHEGAPQAGGQVAVSEQQSQSSTAGMGGSTQRTVASPPGSVRFSTTLTYTITHTFHWDPGTGWSIASLGLVPLAAAFMQRDSSWGPYSAVGTGVKIRFPGADCPPE